MKLIVCLFGLLLAFASCALAEQPPPAVGDQVHRELTLGDTEPADYEWVTMDSMLVWSELQGSKIRLYSVTVLQDSLKTVKRLDQDIASVITNDAFSIRDGRVAWMPPSDGKISLEVAGIDFKVAKMLSWGGGEPEAGPVWTSQSTVVAFGMDENSSPVVKEWTLSSDFLVNRSRMERLDRDNFYGFWHALGPTPQGHLLLTDYGNADVEGKHIAIADISFNPSGVKAVRRLVKFPSRGRLRNIALSRNRLAWFYALPGADDEGHVSPAQQAEVWISAIDGSGMHRALVVVNKDQSPRDLSHDLDRLRWLPDGKHISFIWKDKLYIYQVR